jgi:hypothetical protein
MVKDDKSANEGESSFSFGVTEMRERERADSLALEQPPRKRKDDGGGFDPYNTSGSFDRKKHWERVGKR